MRKCDTTVSDFIVIMTVIVSVCVCQYILGYATCHAKAKALGYQCSWGRFQGCIIEKPNGERVPLKQLRENKE